MNGEQIDFDFLSALPIKEAPPKKRATRSKSMHADAVVTITPKTTIIPPSTNNGINANASSSLTLAQGHLEAMATQLEDSGMYRIIRKLQPQLRFAPPTPGHSVCRVLILDVETTGLDFAKEKIIELAMLHVAVDMDTGLPCGDVLVYDELQDPGRPISAEIQLITGINDNMVRGKTLNETIIKQFIEKTDLVIAHNAGFDRPFVESQFPEFRELAWGCSLNEINWKAMGVSSARLENLAYEDGFFYDAHRAENDCHALLKVLSQFRSSKQKTGLSILMEQSYRHSFKLQANNAPFESKELLKTKGYRWNQEQKVWGITLHDAAEFQAAKEWLKANVYNHKSAVVQLEKLDAKTRYANRQGEIIHQLL